ncbi:single-stranded-DNA-specific exonuclease RecJ [Geoalkalibacter halelectricus]|uniref:single-stranded-DNA-specific exonuclease RecJ n=1 Tax=Geoalkalibacter halelectricus TaxID=2847045 RepID=UPI00266FF121|nr:single-stranded-DNA-specific exonuclease RecJ [Geoalkalibacter halelectricus]MDO3380379.1 single-stranded-DNA-specific exonuclease RecJ [Geoalkalibacter halelectricus]
MAELQRHWQPRELHQGIDESELSWRIDRLMCAGFDPLTARILALRGHKNPQEAKAYLEPSLTHLPDPFAMRDMERAADRVAAAVLRGERVMVSGDYDCDGQGGTALLVEFLRDLGVEISYFLPVRDVDGYGLSERAIRDAAQEGVKVIISVDCGTSNVHEADVARQLGISLIVTDHHQPPDVLPQAFALVNPHQKDCPFPGKELSGVGVAWYLAAAVRSILRKRNYFANRPEPDLKKALDLVALSTVADLVPITGVNRVLVKHGLSVMEQEGRLGLVELAKVAGVKRYSCGTIGFSLGPRLNAGGRLADSRVGVQLLMADCAEKAQEIALELDALNHERQQIEAQILDQCIERIEAGEQGHKSIVLAGEGWEAGVVGIVASRLVERYHKPCVLIALDGNGQGKGSARSIKGFHLFEQLGRCADTLIKFGGHEYAAGLSIEEDRVADLARELDALACTTLSDEDMVPRLYYDAEVGLGDLSVGVVERLSQMEPFGMGNPGPVFVVRGVSPRNARAVGTNHLSFLACDDATGAIKAIAFQQAEKLARLSGEVKVDLLFSPSINEWQGQRSVQLEIKDMRVSEQGGGALC